MTFKEYVAKDLNRGCSEYIFTGESLGGGLGHVAYTKGKSPQLVFPEARGGTVASHIHDLTSNIYSEFSKIESDIPISNDKESSDTELRFIGRHRN